MANSLSHLRWMCKYHIVFIPKYRRKIIYNKVERGHTEIYKGFIFEYHGELRYNEEKASYLSSSS